MNAAPRTLHASRRILEFPAVPCTGEDSPLRRRHGDARGQTSPRLECRRRGLYQPSIPFKDRHLGVDVEAAAAAIQQLALQRRKEALGHRPLAFVVVMGLHPTAHGLMNPETFARTAQLGLMVHALAIAATAVGDER